MMEKQILVLGKEVMIKKLGSRALYFPCCSWRPSPGLVLLRGHHVHPMWEAISAQRGAAAHGLREMAFLCLFVYFTLLSLALSLLSLLLVVVVAIVISVSSLLSLSSL